MVSRLIFNLHCDSHVRVDVLSERLSFRKKLWFELFGILILFLPFIVLVLYYAVPFLNYHGHQMKGQLLQMVCQQDGLLKVF